MNGWVVLLWSVAAALVLIVVGIFGMLVLQDRIQFGGEPETTPTPAKTGEVDTAYRVLILNASGEDGLEEPIRENVLDAGWKSSYVSSGAGSSDDFKNTTIYYVADDDESAALGLADAIGGADTKKSDFYAGLNDSDDGQLVIVIGQDRSTAPPETDAPDAE